VRPYGVDVSSGVERPGVPGIKDEQRVRAFVAAAGSAS
jgi:phosphoribosylanthranilate isomerase